MGYDVVQNLAYFTELQQSAILGIKKIYLIFFSQGNSFDFFPQNHFNIWMLKKLFWLWFQDIVILLDTSGSMTGLRKEIAKHVVINIMETLGEDDFVTVLTFSDETKPLVECFTDSDGEPELVQVRFSWDVRFNPTNQPNYSL